ncbi:MAG: MJ1477/TM1410 family putative glycoside hydrolase [Hyphomicrobiaceae bacterium]
MTPTQILALIALLVIVAAIAYWFGRSGQAGGAGRTPSGPAPIPSEPWARPVGEATEMAGAPKKPAAKDLARPVTTSTAPTKSPQAPPKSAHPIAAYGVTSWGYQLQKLDVGRAAGSPFDLLVIDYAKDGSDDTALSPAELERLKRKPDGGRRIVLAYLSIGEAESYRSYWQAQWKRNKPGWLLGENPEWEENYSVCFWEPEWQQIMCGARDSRLDLILDAGFDGVYLDKCDVYEDLQRHFKKVAAARSDIEGDMVQFISRLATQAKSRNPDFLVVMQNAEGLLEKPALRRVIDGIAKEELVFGVDSPEKKNSKDDFEYSRDALALMKREGKLVLVVEYLNTPAKIKEAAEACAQNGFVLYVSAKNRELDKLNFVTLEA